MFDNFVVVVFFLADFAAGFFFGAVESPLFWLFPTKASLVLIGGAFEPEGISFGEGFLGVLVLAIAAVSAYINDNVRARTAARSAGGTSLPPNRFRSSSSAPADATKDDTSGVPRRTGPSK